MASFHLPTLEEEQLKKWDERNVLKQVFARSNDRSRRPFVFFEGPPTANGKPGIHHLITRAFKDVVLRYKTMQGYRIDRKAGWDTHGLPVELEVEKQLGFTKKQDIEQFGIAAFNKKCRESVWKYLDLWQKSTRRVAFWVDMENPYVTYKNEYVESLWSVFSKIDQQGLLYKGYRVTPHCPRCVTSLSSHELAQGYKDAEDPSVFVKFAVAGAPGKFFLVWTTTPWTLPANVALAVGANVTYVEAKTASGEVLILAEDRLSVLEGEFTVTKKGTWADGNFFAATQGDDGQSYEALYATLPADEPQKDRAYRVYPADFVSTADGTGIVHIAPAFGEEDAKLGKEKNLPTLLTVDTTGFMTGEAPGKGKFFKKADADVKADLTERGLLYKSGTIIHTYPFCWRCDTPVLYYAKSSWYIRMSSLRDKLIANNNQVNWIPGHIKDGRFGEWLKDVKDWAISRERYWGTPLPVWQCGSCEKMRVIGSLKELADGGTPRNTYFLQRHGESACNTAEVVCSWPEPKDHPLTELGRQQVAASAAQLKAAGVQRIFASDLQRTRETAEIIAKETGLEITFDARLREIDFGVVNNKTVQEYHGIVKGDGIDRFTAKPEGGESLNDVRARVMPFLKELQEKYHGEKIVIVSHGDVLWMMQTMCKGLSDAEVLSWPHYNGVGEHKEVVAPANLPYDEMGNVDVHRPFIDEVSVTCGCGGIMRRVPDVADVWFDSGAMPFAQWHYPFENAERIDGGDNFPADYICEAIDQTRGWFYTLLAVSTLLGKDVPPYKNVICLGHVLDGKGKKMSKSKGNVIDPFEAMDKYGADVIRYYLFTVNQPGEAKRFDEKAVDDVTKKVFLILWNVLTYYKMHAGEGATFVAEAPHAPRNEMDAWILGETSRLVTTVSEAMEKYEVTDACREIGAFVNDLSTWYVRRSRDRFKAGGAEAAEATVTLGYVLGTLAKVMAPFTPFAAEALYAELGGKADSIHLEAWPDRDAAKAHVEASAALHGQMAVVRAVSSLGLEQRAATKMPVRQALASATARGRGAAVTDWMAGIIADELNVHEVRFESKDADMSVELDTVLTPALKREGAARELVRKVNDLRKQAGFTIQDRVTVTYATEGDFWPEVLKEHGEALKTDVKADAFVAGAVAEGEGSAALENEGQSLTVRVEKIA